MNRSRCRRDNLDRRPGQRASSAAHACAATPRSTVSPAALRRQGVSTSGARLRRRAVSASAPSTSWPNRHSAVLALNSRCGTRRGFLPRGLCDTCPQLAAGRGAAACAGRCPTTLNRIRPPSGLHEGQRWPVVRARGYVKYRSGPSAHTARSSRQPACALSLDFWNMPALLRSSIRCALHQRCFLDPWHRNLLGEQGQCDL